MTSQRLPDRKLLDFLAASTGRTIDLLYCSIVHRFGGGQPFFSSGWGDLSVVNFNEDAKAFERWPPPHFDVKIQWEKKQTGTQKGSGTAFELLEGTFRTPCMGRVFDALPEESRTARVQLLVPQKSPAAHACVLHLAATGDQSFRSRVALGAPLLSQGIATMVLESPFYGSRAPAVQKGSRLQRVSDLLTLGRSTIEESLCLLNWAAMQGFIRLGMSGFSMGGVHACMATSLYPFPIACTPLLAPRSAAVAYCQGALHRATAWRSLLVSKDEKQQDITSTILSAAQPNLVTAAALRVLQNPRLHRPATETVHHAEVSTARHSNRHAAPCPKRYSSESLDAETVSTSQRKSGTASNLTEERWRTREATPQHVCTGSVTAESISGSGDQVQGASDGSPVDTDKSAHQRRTESEPAGSSHRENEARIHWHALTKLHGVSDSQSASGQKRWLGIRGFGIDVAERLLRDLWRDDHTLEREAARLSLEQVLETYTDVTRFPQPQWPRAAIIVGAREDQYVLPSSVQELAEHWAGSEVRWVSGGHVTAFVLQQPAFRQAICDSLARLP